MTQSEYAEQQRQRRERIATAVLQGLVVEATVPTPDENSTTYRRLAQKSIALADELIRQLDTNTPKPEVTSR